METPSFRYLKELSKTNREFEMKISNLILEELSKEYSTYQKANITKNFYWALEILSKMKHKIVYFEMWDAISLSEKHEEALIIGKLKYQNEFEGIINGLLKFLPQR